MIASAFPVGVRQLHVHRIVAPQAALLQYPAENTHV